MGNKRIIIWTNTGNNITIEKVTSYEFKNDTLFIKHIGYAGDEGFSTFKKGAMWAGWTVYPDKVKNGSN